MSSTRQLVIQVTLVVLGAATAAAQAWADGGFEPKQLIGVFAGALFAAAVKRFGDFSAAELERAGLDPKAVRVASQRPAPPEAPGARPTPPPMVFRGTLDPELLAKGHRVVILDEQGEIVGPLAEAKEPKP